MKITLVSGLKRKRELEREREGEREREREAVGDRKRQTDRQTDRDREINSYPEDGKRFVKYNAHELHEIRSCSHPCTACTSSLTDTAACMYLILDRYCCLHARVYLREKNCIDLRREKREKSHQRAEGRE